MRNLPEFDRYGVDIALDYLEIARSEGIEASLARVEDLPYTDESFDTVVCTDVLEHVIDLNAACVSLARVLRPGGRLIVRVPYREDLTYYASDACPYEFAHLRTFDVPTLVLLFEHAMGMEVIDVMHASFLYTPDRLKDPGDASRLLTLNNIASAHSGEQRWALSEALMRPFVDGTEINVVVRKPLAGEAPARLHVTPREHLIADGDALAALVGVVSEQLRTIERLEAEITAKTAELAVSNADHEATLAAADAAHTQRCAALDTAHSAQLAEYERNAAAALLAATPSRAELPKLVRVATTAASWQDRLYGWFSRR